MPSELKIPPLPSPPERMDDVCALPLVRRVAATLDQDPAGFRDGQALPRGWHVALFTPCIPESAMRPDGVSGIALPDLGLPRLVMGGKRTRFEGDIVIGAQVRRSSQVTAIMPKQGRTGALAIVTITHTITCGDRPDPVLTEEQDYVMRAADDGTAAPAPAEPAAARDVTAACDFTPDETFLFRYSAITFNAHRIHIDHPYTTGVEGYPALVVNGGISLLLLTEFFKRAAGREPSEVNVRNAGLVFCGQVMHLKAQRNDPAWILWVENPDGAIRVTATIR